MPAPPLDPLPPLADRRLRRLRRLCAVLCASVALLGALSWPLAGELPVALSGEVRQIPIVLTVFAMILLLGSSRLRTSILRRATAGRLTPDPDAVLAAYGRATLLSFAALEAAAVLGPLVALLSGEARYGFVVCGAALLAMLSRWPRRGEALRLPGLRPTPARPPLSPGGGG